VGVRCLMRVDLLSSKQSKTGQVHTPSREQGRVLKREPPQLQLRTESARYGFELEWRRD
jgi:hypothetical protein